jgi:hypothetical protein
VVYNAFCVRFSRWLVLPLLVGCATAPPPQKVLLDPCTVIECVAHDNSAVHVKSGKLIAGTKELTPQLEMIQSFDVSLERREVIFSAKHDGKLDIGLVSLDGSDIHWFPSDPADETDARWAPRGNKVSYIVHLKSADVIRTVHVPTATQLSVEFPYATIRKLEWDKAGQRYAVVVTSPDASDRIESMKYDGTGRRTDLASAEKLDVAEEPAGGALLIRPSTMHYGEKLPLVVWVADPPFVWNAERSALMRKERVACAIMRHAPDDAFRAAISNIPWIDSSRITTHGR